MTTAAEVRLPTLDELEAVDDQVAEAFNEAEKIEHAVDAYRRVWDEEGHGEADEVPTHAQIGALFLFSEHMSMDGQQIIDNGVQIREALQSIDSVRLVMLGKKDNGAR